MNSKFYITTYLLLLISLGYVATDIYLPSLPALSIYFHASDNEVQMTLFSYLLSFSLAPLIFGPLSDHMGRKKILIFGVALGTLSTFGCLFAQSIDWLIIARFLQGIGMGAGGNRMIGYAEPSIIKFTKGLLTILNLIPARIQHRKLFVLLRKRYVQKTNNSNDGIKKTIRFN